MTDFSDITVAFWNRNRTGNRPRQIEYLSSCAVPWDVLLLAEMTGIAFRDFRDRLHAIGASAHLSGVADRRYPHGVAVLVRHGLTLGDAEPILSGYPADDVAPREERSLTVPLRGATIPLRLAIWHAPNAAETPRQRARLRKQRAYVEMSQWLERPPDPVVLGVDGNTWYEPETRIARGVGRRDVLFAEERAFHSDPTSHGLVDTLRQARPTDVAELRPGGPPLAVTKVIPSGPLRMDRIYTSPALEVLDAGVDYDGRAFSDIADPRHLAAGSDHALVWAKIGLVNRRPG